MRKFVVAALAATVSVHAAAQDQAGAILYSRGHFTGASTTITGPTRSMTPFQVKSIRIPAGTAWDLCSGNTFSGCERYSESKAAMTTTVRSVRPVAPPIVETATISSVGAGPIAGSGPSLHGLATEFFVVPAQNGARVEVTDKAAGAASAAATEFCQQHGWRMSGYERVQTVSGRTFLADTLCVNEDR